MPHIKNSFTGLINSMWIWMKNEYKMTLY